MNLPVSLHKYLVRIARNLIFCLIIFTPLLMISCRQSGNGQEAVQASFNVDQSLLEKDPLTDPKLSFKMQYPDGWEMLKDAFRNRLAEQILVGRYAPARIVGGVVHPVDSSMLIILDVSQVDSSFFLHLKENYAVILNQDNRWVNVQLETFTHHCFVVDQYVLQNENLVQFRLQCRKKEDESLQPRMEIYFFLNRTTLNEHIKSIESSIGTLNCLN